MKNLELAHELVRLAAQPELRRNHESFGEIHRLTAKESRETKMSNPIVIKPSWWIAGYWIKDVRVLSKGKFVS
jgi:hypothetical protein